MKLDDRQKRKLFIAGTVALPPPFPQLGDIWIEREGTVSGENTQHGSQWDVLCVCTCHEPFCSVERRVLLTEVAAVFIPEKPDETEIDLTKGEFILGPELRRREEVPDRHDTAWRGIVFVPETARVLIRSETGMTAADSLHYYRSGCCPCDCPPCDCDCCCRCDCDKRSARLESRSIPCDCRTSPCDCQC